MTTYYGIQMLEKEASMQGFVKRTGKTLSGLVPGVTEARVSRLKNLNNVAFAKKNATLNAQGFLGSKRDLVQHTQGRSEAIDRAATFGQKAFPKPEVSVQPSYAF